MASSGKWNVSLCCVCLVTKNKEMFLQHLECVINQASLRMNDRFFFESLHHHSQLPITALIDEVLIFETRFLVTNNNVATRTTSVHKSCLFNLSKIIEHKSNK